MSYFSTQLFPITTTANTNSDVFMILADLDWVLRNYTVNFIMETAEPDPPQKEGWELWLEILERRRQTWMDMRHWYWKRQQSPKVHEDVHVPRKFHIHRPKRIAGIGRARQWMN